MEIDKRTLPRCICGYTSSWEKILPVKRKHFVSTQYSCRQCGRVSRNIVHECGNVFVMPREHVMYFPSTTRQYIEQVAVPFFESNRRELVRRQTEIEVAWTVSCLRELLLPDTTSIKELDDVDYAAFIARFSRVYSDPNWQTPPGFDFTPIPPPAPRPVIVHFFRTALNTAGWLTVRERAF